LSTFIGLRAKNFRARYRHNERGAETIERIVSMFAGHDLNHFQQIDSILAAKKK